MKAKRKIGSSKEVWAALRGQYTWYLRPPFDEEFDHRHWWEGQADIDKIEPVSALYELARRHPVVGAARSKFHLASWYGMELSDRTAADRKVHRFGKLAHNDLGGLPSAVRCLCLIGLKTWEDLTWREKDFWIDTAGSIKGVDCRSDLERCASINNEVITDILVGLASKLKRKNKVKTHAEFNRLVARQFLKSTFPDDKFEQAIAEYAVFALRNDFLLIAIARDLKTDEARLLLERRYREHQRLHRVPKQRSRSPNWLPLISELESNPAAQQNAKSDTFIRFRRAIDLIHFSSTGPGVHPSRCRHILAAREFFLNEIFKALADLARRQRA